MTDTLTATDRRDFVQRKINVATVLLTRSMNDLDELTVTLGARNKKGGIRPVKGMRLADVRNLLDEAHMNGLLALAELLEVYDLEAGLPLDRAIPTRR